MGREPNRATARGRDRDAVVSWRRQRLLDAGFSATSSERLARDLRIELHRLLDLVQSGCTPELAARILAPLDGESRRR
jgi:hypothetical protein